MNQCWSYLYIAIKMTLVSLIAVYLALTMMPFFFVQISGHKFTVDLSYTLDSNVMKWITAKEYEIKIKNGTGNYGNATNVWYQSDEINLSTHTGTHLDAPIHFGKNKFTVAQIPLDHLIERPLSIIDIVEQARNERDYSANVDDIKQWEDANGEIPEQSVVIFKTGWSKFWPVKLNYFGTDTKDPKLAHFPGIHQDAARWLVENRKIVGVGIDGPSADCGQCGFSYGNPTHVVFGNANVYILENIQKSIFSVPSVGATITVLPLKLADASGSPVRAIAQYTHNHADINLALNLQPSYILLIFSLLLAVYQFSH